MNLPDVFRKYFLEILDASLLKAFEDLPDRTPAVIRFNPLKNGKTVALERLRTSGFRLRPLPFYEEAFVVEGEPFPVSKTIEHFLGYFYIQSPASMFPPFLMDLVPKKKVLDIAAAPGSKTTQIAEIMNNHGVLVANEWDDKRIKTLSHNLERIGVLNTALVNMPGERIGNILPETFDAVLVDAPCSALGVIHKAPQAVENISKVSLYAAIQERLLISAIKSLRTGGILVYSTCTISPEENELLIHRLLAHYPIQMLEITAPDGFHAIPALTRIGTEPLSPEIAKAIRFIPNENNPESFFIAKLQKTDSLPLRNDSSANPNPRLHFQLTSPDPPPLRRMFEYFHHRFGIPEALWNNYRYYEKNDEILIAAAEWEDQERLLNRLYTHRVGLRAARIRKPGEWKLSTNLAQLIAPHIHQSTVKLTDPYEIKTFIEGGILHKAFDVNDGGVVVYGDAYPLGCGVVHQGKLKSQMPKSRKVIGVDYSQ